MAKRPTDVVGWYIPVSRETDFRNELPDPKTGELVVQPSMTKQEFIAECDINNIIKEFSPQGLAQLTAAAVAAGGFADLPDHMDLQESMEIQRAASAAFDALPAKVRDRFANDPGRFLEFFHDPANREEADRLGLIQQPAPPPPPVEVVIKGPNPAAGSETGGAGGSPPAGGAKAP